MTLVFIIKKNHLKLTLKSFMVVIYDCEGPTSNDAAIYSGNFIQVKALVGTSALRFKIF